jgi:hypothetical protein
MAAPGMGYIPHPAGPLPGDRFMRRVAPALIITLTVIASSFIVRGLPIWAQSPTPGAYVAAAAPPAAAPAGGGGTEVVVKGVSSIPITFDGHVSKFEYGDATHSTFPNGHGTVDVYAKCYEGYVYFAFLIPDLSPFPGDDIVVMLDPVNSRAAAPAKTDIRAYVRRKMENSRQYRGDGQKWVDYYGEWEYRSALYATGWEIEVRHPLKSLGIEAGKKTTMGLAFRIWDNEPEKIWNWPLGSSENKPNTWGTLVFAPAE